jgi:hypothetical protein
MNYYKKIDNVLYDGRLIQLAEESVKGAGDGRISRPDAEKLLALVKDGNTYTQVEKETVKFLHRNFKWTEAAWDWFLQEVKSFEKEFEKPLQMTPEQLSKQQFPEQDVLATDTEKDARTHDLRAATTETYQDHDEITIIVRLANGKRVEVASNFIELAGQFVELRGGFDIPVRAVEKVEI